MLSVFLTCLLIVAARITDVSLGTIRTINVVQGRRTLALVLGFFEVLIWVFVVSRVINEIRQPAYALAYALGFADPQHFSHAFHRVMGMSPLAYRGRVSELQTRNR